MSDPYQVVRDFEAALCEYTGAAHAVAVNSCTNALFLALKWVLLDGGGVVEIPKRTYISVPMQIMHAGATVAFRDEDWVGEYQLRPLALWDSARRFTSGMFRPGEMQCLSFHASKILSVEQGGAILLSRSETAAWFRRARFDGRTEGVAPKNDEFKDLGWHCHMSPSVAAQGLLKIYSLPRNNPDLPNDDYPDLSKMRIFK